MNEKGLYHLEIDEEFRQLIRPLQKKEFEQLRKNLLKDGCIDPIITWNGIIIDGHNRYRICMEHGIPFSVVEMHFTYREEVVSWICEHQLGRRNISEETRKYLIGMQYEAAKIAKSRLNPTGINQFSPSHMSPDRRRKQEQTELSAGHITAQRIGDQNHVSWNTVNKYAMYSRAVEEIRKKVPEAVSSILSGQYKISQNNVIELSKLDPDQIRLFIQRLDSPRQEYVQYKKTRREIQDLGAGTATAAPPSPSVKDVPQYDPDAEITALTLTIPTWSSSIERARKSTEPAHISAKAKEKLSLALHSLQDQITLTLDELEVE